MMEGRPPPRDTPFERYQNYQTERMEKMQGSLMLVATVIATMTFQIALNPPGGVWQSDSKHDMGCASNETCKAGTSVLAFSDGNQKSIFEIFIVLCTISFSASLTIILLLICGFSLRKRLIMWLLIIAMCISVYCTAAAYILSIWLVMNPLEKTVFFTLYRVYGFYWVGLAVLLFLVIPLCRFIFWLLKMFLECIKRCCCCH